ncbi:MAG: uroporphyrinogen-III C-methyltransferase [Acidobacteria bacterium]|nr:uroporphyrinogen-III C-methyltransferase [Acidobacteriota bacterium]MBM4197960.1 uroporphyrinogen-III C-methyltransferase [Gammaproteobacteria bacterium]
MKVYLVGAGPGDPELITAKGLRALEEADAVLYDNLAPLALLDRARPEAERLYVGKKRAAHEIPQDEICRMMIERARRGLTVVRLKGGDPFIFGRGGEEAEALAEAGIPFEVVPGVTAPLGIAAYTGVPLTHREHASMVAFVTGHEPERIDWRQAASAETLVIFMGLSTFREIARELIAAGRPPGTPAMAVRWGTRPDQRTIVGTLATLADLICASGLKPPATLFVGEVVRLRQKLNWFERLPLFGQTVVVTRARHQAGALAEKLRRLGAEAIELPTIEIAPAQDYGPLDRAIAQLEQYHWLIFTSANSVRFFLERLDRSGRDLRALKAAICAIGPATREAIEKLHLKVDLMGEEYAAEGLIEAFAGHGISGKRILLPRAAIARELARRELARRGARVDVVEAYRTILPDGAAEEIERIFSAERRPGWATFTSSSTVANFVAAGGARRLDGVKVASIGPVTTATAKSLGVTVSVEAKVYTTGGLIQAILEKSSSLNE